MFAHSHLAKLSSRLVLILLGLALVLTACTNESVPKLPAPGEQGAFEFLVDPQRQTVTLIANETPTPSLHPQYLPSDTRILVPDVDIALKNYHYVFHRGNKLIIQTRFRNITEDAAFHQPFFFTLNADTEHIKSATAPLVMDKDLGGDGVLSPQEKTSRLTFEVRHKSQPFSFFVDASAVVQEMVVCPGKIAYSSLRGGYYDIFAINADGTGEVNLTNSKFDEFDPAWSPDGSKVAYTSIWEGLLVEVYTVSLDGSEPINLTQRPVWDYNYTPQWSPDGSQIAFISDRNDPFVNDDVYVMNADGTDQTNLTDHPAPDYGAAWSPDGRKIAFGSKRDGNSEIYVMNADGADPTRLTNNPTSDFSPTWSPDGNKIAYTSYQGGTHRIYVMNADGTNPTMLVDNVGDITWSPDSTKIAFGSNGNGEVYVINADGTGQTNLTRHPASDGRPAWSSDGSKILFLSDRDGNNEIYVMNPDGTEQTRVTNTLENEQQATWQPCATP